MKKRFSFPLILLVLICTVLFCANATTTQSQVTESAISGKKDKVLIAYFTMPETDGVDAVAGASRVIVNGDLFGSTQYIAKIIQEETGGDMFAIKTVRPYPGDHKPLIDYAKKEIDTRTKPKLVTHIKNISDYDVIFVGFPNWWYDMPMPLYTFFEEYDLKDKTIIPFCTHGGSGFSQTVQTITNLEKGAKVVKGLSISRNNVPEAKTSVLKWLREIGMMRNNP